MTAGRLYCIQSWNNASETVVFTKEWILKKAQSGLSVNKYSWVHEKLRKKARRLCKDGFLKLEWQNKSEFFYKIT